MKHYYSEVKVVKTGLWVSKEYPFVGGSPDAVITFRNENGEYEAGLVEIKSLFVLENKDPNFFELYLTKSQLSNFCLKRSEDGRLFLKDTHPYYFQIQLNLFIQKLKWCDFVAWTEVGAVIIRVARDENLFDEAMMQKIFLKYQSLYVPEYFLQRTVRNLKPIEILYE